MAGESMALQNLPAESGTYALVMRLPQPQWITVGRLGTFLLTAGPYIYVGSAFGPGGLRARISRHMKCDKPLHWHIDNLRSHVSIQAVLCIVSRFHFECTWSQVLAQIPGASIPIAHFGAMDCLAGCQAHLIALPEMDLSNLERTLWNARYASTA